MSANKKKLMLNTVSIKLGCSSCKKPNLSSIFHPKPKPKTPTYHKHKNLYCSSSSSSKTNPSPNYDQLYGTSTTFSPDMDTPPYFCCDTDMKCSKRTVRGFGRVGGESVAVEKESDDPYLDFRHSMLQMILEKEIYSKDDLRELLNCFLQLNSPYHHGIIVRVFTEIWNGVFSVRSSSSGWEKLHYNGC